MKRRSKFLGALAAVGLAVGVSLTAAAPAYADYEIVYYADCPGLAEYQQLVIRPFGNGGGVQVWSAPNYDQSISRYTGTSGGPGSIYYNKVFYNDKVKYAMYTPNKDYYYHVSCYYY